VSNALVAKKEKPNQSAQNLEESIGVVGNSLSKGKAGRPPVKQTKKAAPNSA